MSDLPEIDKGNLIDTYQAGVFDLDGVVTRTASVHCASWKQLFDDYLGKRASQTGEPFRPFDETSDYLRYVDGKPRYEGVASFLESRGISLPQGSPDDPPERETICGLGNRKNRLFNEQLTPGNVEVFASTIALIESLRAAGLKIALVSSSENAVAVLEAAGASHLFDARIDGVESSRLGLKGKPAPDLFLHAARVLGVVPQHAFGVEDALSGVESARAAGYGLVIGVDRVGQRDALLKHGADIVVSDLAELARDETSLPDALEHYEEIAKRLEGAQPAVFLDYDGTLTPIVDRPELAVLDETTREGVITLAERFTVGVISGRDRADVERLVGIDNLIYAGSHGFDIAGPNGLSMEHERAAEFLPALDRAEARLRQVLARIDGVLVERKRFAIAVHYRLVAQHALDEVEAAVKEVAEADPEALRRTGGKKVFELRAKLAWDKGRALRWLLEALDLNRDSVVAFYVGDDETDEDAFVALRELGGIGVLVADQPQPTAAHYRVKDPEAVGDFLRRLASHSSR